jgi:hypothetical protein
MPQATCKYQFEWKIMERLTGANFEPNDFVSDDQSIEFPASWGVMF